MNYFFKPILGFVLAICTFGITGCQSSDQEPSSSLSVDSSSTTRVDAVFPNTPDGKLIKEHLKVSMGFGKDAEEKYQNSLTHLRANPEVAQILYKGYKEIALEHYLYRTMIVEAIKQIRSEASLDYLNMIASERIPKDQFPENAEINTQQDEIVIRITAVEGISLLAKDSIASAEKLLTKLIGHNDLTVRQMATRGYLHSPFGNQEEKTKKLLERLPKEEHWYVTTSTTDIKKVKHPEMPDKFDFPRNNNTESPKIEQ
ncbi:hypothetical protein [Aquimarina sediminis]|uniref:hypothetical protein n=1 Tax=Aquimarina sediminis TaxID=2070536 RepID=UPI000CA08A4F|nr:hypothetical protein [Aquimarina sediminis]